MKAFKLSRLFSLPGLVLCLLLWGEAAHAAATATVAPPAVLSDMAGTAVTVPRSAQRIATVGPVPVLNSLLFALGAGGTIINGLPEFARHPRWAYQAVFAPQIAKLPSLQNPDSTPNLEALLASAPDSVLTMDRPTADTLRRAGLPAFYVAWRRPEDVKEAVRLLGQLLSRQQAAERYVARFDAMLADVARRLHAATSRRPRVLYFSPATLTQPHLVAEWWIRAAGGESVTDDGRNVESVSFTVEKLLSWNPDILIVPSREDAALLLRDARYAGLKAVREGRILVAPCGAHTWANRSAEQPLTVLWAAAQFHPEAFADLDISSEVRRFYLDIFGVGLSLAQVNTILGGGPRN